MSDRPYRKGADLSIAIRELTENAGSQFDPKLVNLFLNLLRGGKVNLQQLYGHEYDMSCLENVAVTETVSA
jgi:HD-GYP domain-containing protein (c-di-GMP phosphodiesterase class II)